MPALCLAVLALPAVTAQSAQAAPPPNDDRGDAQQLEIPSKVSGTTAESTREDAEQSSFCGQDGGSVWYRVTPRQKGRVVVSLSANGDLDALVDVYRVQRSQLSQVTCERTDRDGRASLAFRTRAGETYLVRVSQLVGSASGTFELGVQLAQPAARPPGPPLPRRGARGELDRVLNPSVAYSIRMHEGATYRFHLATGEACTPLEIYPPHTRSFETGSPVKRLSCGGYMLFTPRGGQGGTYSVLASAPRQRGSFPYRLTGGRAGKDDTAPGRLIRNHARVRGALSGGGIDVVDLYRFDVRRRSALRVAVRSRAGFELNLLRDTGHVLRSSSGEIRTRIARGRYYLAVRAAPGTSGSYTLTRLSRTLTRTRLTANDGKSTSVRPRERVRLGVEVRPGDRGPVRIVIERFDPLEGWQFSRRYSRRTASDGRLAIEWTPPSVGRYRVQASFRGTRRSSPSRSGHARVRAQAPLST
jgi:hypothetical protein